MTDNEPLESQVKRLADFILANVPGEPSRSEGAIDVAIRLLALHYGPRPRTEAEAIDEAIAQATANPGRVVEVEQ